jgi:hypothetical protein
MRGKGENGFTKKTDCLWKLYVSKTPTINDLWKISIRNLEHNHDIDTSPFGFARHRKLTPREKASALTALGNNASPSAVLETLHRTAADENRLCFVSLQEIYNLKAAQRKLAMSGRTPADAVVREMICSGISHAVFLNDHNELQGLFFTNPLAIILTEYYGYVLHMDATYKTNKHGMPLLHIVGSSPTNKSFTVALCFMTTESEE